MIVWLIKSLGSLLVLYSVSFIWFWWLHSTAPPELKLNYQFGIHLSREIGQYMSFAAAPMVCITLATIWIFIKRRKDFSFFSYALTLVLILCSVLLGSELLYLALNSTDYKLQDMHYVSDLNKVHAPLPNRIALEFVVSEIRTNILFGVTAFSMLFALIRLRVVWLFIIIALPLSGDMARGSLSAWYWFSGMQAAQVRMEDMQKKVIGARVIPEREIQLERLISNSFDSAQTNLRILRFHEIATRAFINEEYLILQEADFDFQKLSDQHDNDLYYLVSAIRSKNVRGSGRDYARGFVDAASMYMQSRNEYEQLTAKATNEHKTYEKYLDDRNELFQAQTPKAWVTLWIAVGMAMLLSMVVLHLVQLRVNQGRFLLAGTTRLSGYLVLLHAILPILIACIFIFASWTLVERASPEIHDIQDDAALFRDDIVHELEIGKTFFVTEKNKFEHVLDKILELEKKVEHEITDEFRVVSNELKKDFLIAKHTLVNVEEQAIGQVKQEVAYIKGQFKGIFSGVNNALDSVRGAFNVDLGPFGDIPLGDWIASAFHSVFDGVFHSIFGKLNFDLGLSDWFHDLAVNAITGLQQPFMEPLKKLKAIEYEIEHMIDDDFRELKADLEILRSVQKDVAFLSAQLNHGKDAVMHDTISMIEDISFLLRQVLWFLLVVLGLVGLFVLYILLGWTLSFVLRIRTAWTMIRV